MGMLGQIYHRISNSPVKVMVAKDEYATLAFVLPVMGDVFNALQRLLRGRYKVSKVPLNSMVVEWSQNVSTCCML